MSTTIESPDRAYALTAYAGPVRVGRMIQVNGTPGFGVNGRDYVSIPEGVLMQLLDELGAVERHIQASQLR